jgi:hypothetical protein
MECIQSDGAILPGWKYFVLIPHRTLQVLWNVQGFWIASDWMSAVHCSCKPTSLCHICLWSLELATPWIASLGFACIIFVYQFGIHQYFTVQYCRWQFAEPGTPLHPSGVQLPAGSEWDHLLVGLVAKTCLYVLGTENIFWLMNMKFRFECLCNCSPNHNTYGFFILSIPGLWF